MNAPHHALLQVVGLLLASASAARAAADAGPAPLPPWVLATEASAHTPRHAWVRAVAQQEWRASPRDAPLPSPARCTPPKDLWDWEAALARPPSPSADGCLPGAVKHLVPEAGLGSSALEAATRGRLMLLLAARLHDGRMRALALDGLNRWVATGYRPGGGFAHALGPAGPYGTATLGDQAAMVRAMLVHHAVTGSPSAWQAAQQTVDVILAHYLKGDVFTEPDGQAAAVADGALGPSPVGEALLALMETADVARSLELRARAGQLARAAWDGVASSPPDAPTVAMALWLGSHPPVQAVLRPRDGNHNMTALAEEVLRLAKPGVSIRRETPSADAGDGAAVCTPETCSPMTHQADQLRSWLTQALEATR